MLREYPWITFDGRDFSAKGYEIDSRCRSEGRFYEVESTGSYYATQDCIEDYKARCGTRFRSEFIPGSAGCLDDEYSSGYGTFLLNVAQLGLLGKSWVADGLTQEELEVIDVIDDVANSRQNKRRVVVRPNEAPAMRIADMPFLETLEDADALALNGLYVATTPLHTDYFSVIMSHPALSGGITDDLTGVIASVATIVWGKTPEGRSYTPDETIQKLNALLDSANLP